MTWWVKSRNWSNARSARRPHHKQNPQSISMTYQPSPQFAISFFFRPEGGSISHNFFKLGRFDIMPRKVPNVVFIPVIPRKLHATS